MMTRSAAIAKQPTQRPAAPTEPFAPVVVTLAGHPRGKGRPRRARLPNGIFVMHTDPKTRDYEANLHYAATRAMQGRPPFTGPLAVTVEAFFPIPASWSKKRRNLALGGEIRPTVIPDWNNLGGVTDGCNGVLWQRRSADR